MRRWVVGLGILISSSSCTNGNIPPTSFSVYSLQRLVAIATEVYVYNLALSSCRGQWLPRGSVTSPPGSVIAGPPPGPESLVTWQKHGVWWYHRHSLTTGSDLRLPVEDRPQTPTEMKTAILVNKVDWRSLSLVWQVLGVYLVSSPRIKL